MTIRRHVDLNAINSAYRDFQEACERAPLGMFEQARSVNDLIGETVDGLIARAHNSTAGIKVDNCDGIREIEALIFDMFRNKNPDSEIEAAIGLGRTLSEHPESAKRVLDGLQRDRDFLTCRIDEDQYAPTPILGNTDYDMSTFKEEADALVEGEGGLWEVRILNLGDDCDWVDFLVRAPTMDEAALRVEKHARKYPDMYFDIERPPTFDADRHNIYPVEGDDA